MRGDAFSARVDFDLTEAAAAALAAARRGRAAWRDAGPCPLGGGDAAAAGGAPGPAAEAPAARWEVDFSGCPPELLARLAGALPAACGAEAGEAEVAQPPPSSFSPSSLALPPPLLSRWAAATGCDGWASQSQAGLAAHLASYRDVLWTARSLPPPFDPTHLPARGDDEDDGGGGGGGAAGGAGGARRGKRARRAASPARAAAAAAATASRRGDEMMDAVLLHALGHCLRTRSRVLHGSERLRKAAAAASAARAPPPDPPQDQGFARPKVLLLLPMRSFALRWLLRLIDLAPAAHTGAPDAVSKLPRFCVEYGPRPDEAGLNPRSIRRKPADFARLFGGNRDDHFRIGVKLTRNSVRLFTDFAGSDIIIASPLGLATRLAAGDGAAGGPAAFLSSIELVVADGADVLMQQNWAHTRSVFEALNLLPSGAVGGDAGGLADVMRVRPWALAGFASHYRQTVLLSPRPAPQLSALLRDACANAAGRARCVVPVAAGAIARCGSVGTTTHAFTRIDIGVTDACSAPDARFAHFVARVWPRLRDGPPGQLLFVPSYFDFVRLRNFLTAHDASFATNCEHDEAGDVGKARARFSAGDARLLVVTERAVFFRRQAARGARRVTFYAPPDTPSFYSDVVRGLEPPPGEAGEAATLFTAWDAVALRQLVGDARAAKMLRRGGGADFLFC